MNRIHDYDEIEALVQRWKTEKRHRSNIRRMEQGGHEYDEDCDCKCCEPQYNQGGVF